MKLGNRSKYQIFIVIQGEVYVCVRNGVEGKSKVARMDFRVVIKRYWVEGE